jgi:hypothetical protein
MSLTLGSIINGTEDGEQSVAPSTDSGSDGDSSGAESIEGRTGEPERIAGYPAIDPIEWPTVGTSAGTKRRGRPPGSKNRASAGTPTITPAREKAPQNLTDLDGLILSAHLMCAKVLSIPELELDEKESEKLAASIRNLAKHYTAVFDPKKIAMFELACCAGSIYGPRAIAMYKRSADTLRPAKVVQMNKQPAPEEKIKLSDLSPSQIWEEGG